MSGAKGQVHHSLRGQISRSNDNFEVESYSFELQQLLLSFNWLLSHESFTSIVKMAVVMFSFVSVCLSICPVE